MCERGRVFRIGLRLLSWTAIGIGAAAGLVVATVGMAIAEGMLVRERLGATRLDSVLPRSGTFGGDQAGPAVALGMMGDSLAVGYGAESPDGAPGVVIAEGLAEASGRPVVLTNVAAVGAESTALITQLAHLRALATPDVVVIMIGANDVMHLKRLTDALWPLSETVRQLRRGGAQVVVATCPDLGTVHPFSQPLRFFAHWYSRVLATGQVIVVLRAGGRTVSLADTLGPLFHLDPDDMFSAHDHLHPSSVGYLAAAEVILPSVRVAAGFPIPGDERIPHRIYRRGSRHPLAWWAFRASRRVGARLTAYESMAGTTIAG
ncbi:SGNH/GDSL hydrolase family protein [Microbacterium sp. ASV49]|uniref:SGNH/GDSL hydrolase family protein n=1 Tax=Microbacterium candidum TaxID=3041922 RepID=A0ABT7N473_9MICO|nr:SGNH/GDSL hydrolase family protein [Microbacterium sp. ASV49]MDL9981499.1 SGNH/GDSL hydrolase family protein [Microbacterium sp. ASV49]